MNEYLLLHDKYFCKPSLIKAAKMVTGNKIIIAGSQCNKDITRQQIIDRFLKNWLTDKQSSGMPWFNEMLDAFAIEVLLQAQKRGIEKLLLLSDFRAEKTHYPLVLVPSKPEKPKKMKVSLEEVGGDLAFEAKTISLLQNTEQFDICG